MTTERGGGPASAAALVAAEGEVTAGAEPTLDALRRRVYGPDADADDVARYARALEQARFAASPVETAPDQEEAPDQDDPSIQQAAPGPASDGAGLASSTPVRITPAARRRAVVISTAVVVVVLGVAVGLAQRATPPPAHPLPAPTALTVDAADRAAFLRDLDGGRRSGLVRWLEKHPEVGPPVQNGRLFRVDVSTGTAIEVHTDEFAGTGTETVSLLPPTAASRKGGRATVILVLGADAEVTWTLSTLALYPDRTVHLRVVTRRAGAQSAGVPTAATVAFPAGSRPMRLTVAVPKGVRWEAVVSVAG